MTDVLSGVSGVCAQLERLNVPRARTQIIFQSVAIENIAIDGLLLPDLIARDTPAKL